MITDKPRPYWHVDAKWICGLLGLGVVSLLLLVIGFYRLTDRHRAPAFVQELISSAFSNPNEPVDTAKLKQQLAPLYKDGVGAVTKQAAPDPASQKKLTQQLAPLGNFTAQGHSQTATWMVVVSVPVIVLLAGLVYFSAGAGRLVSPAVVLLLAALPGALAFLTMASGQGEDGVRLASLGPSVLRLVGEAFLAPFLAALVAAVLLLIAAAIVKIRRR